MNIADKIIKLIRLAENNPNENEAANAWARAQRMATRHQLDLDGLIEDSREDETVEWEPPTVGDMQENILCRWDKIVTWKRRLGQELAWANCCNTYWRSGKGGGLWVYGEEKNRTIVTYMFERLVRQCEKAARVAINAYKSDPDLDPRFDDSPRMFGRNFRMGFVHTIMHRLPKPREVVTEATEQSTSLVRQSALAHLDAVDAALTEYKKNAGIRTRNLRVHTTSGRGSGYFEGRHAGKKATMVGGLELVEEVG